MSQKFTCIICGYKTLDARCDWDICPLCFWEDDVLWRPGDEDTSSSANGMTVSQAQKNFVDFGAVNADAKMHVRALNAQDMKDPDWRPIS